MMANDLVATIVSEDDSLRNRSITSLLQNKSKGELLRYAEELELFRTSSSNLYHKVRASLFLFVIYRFYLQDHKEFPRYGVIPLEGIRAAYERRFNASIESYLKEMSEHKGYNSALFSALAQSYYKMSFQYLLDQVKLSMSLCKENFLLFNIQGLDDYPYSVLPGLTARDTETGLYPVGLDTAPVRLDPSHSGWSDIFFLGMDFPEGARVVNISVNLKIHGSEGPITPPCECYCRYIEEPAIHLVSFDLKTSKKIFDIEELFNFGNDYLSLLKAGIVASGIVPPCFEKGDIPLNDILQKLLHKPGGIEVVTRVNNIPKGSRLAVSTTLLATIITCLMRYSGQIMNQTGPLKEAERRIVASRAILGEWLGGSGGGWQDSGGLWPGIKLITGRLAEKGDPEFSVSRGCLLPDHTLFSGSEISEEVEERIRNSMVLVHGGISLDVGPILEMVTEKYLLKNEQEWSARLRGIQLFDKIVHALKSGDMKTLGRLTTRDWEESIQQVIPWVNNAFTEDLIQRVKEEFRDDYWGFLMLGGMSGGGMAFVINPVIQGAFKKRVLEIMKELKALYSFSFPFIIDPLVYDFEFNHEGVVAQLLKGHETKIPALDGKHPEKEDVHISSIEDADEERIKKQYGFDSTSHEHMKAMLKRGEIGLNRNRIALSDALQDVSENEIIHFEDEEADTEVHASGMEALRKNEVAVVTFAGGLGSRWTHGAAVVKPINPFIEVKGKYRTFLELHLAKSRKTGELTGQRISHVFTTSYLTHSAITDYLKRFHYFNYEGPVYLSSAKTIGHRVYPTERDIRFYWEEQPRQKLDEHAQKVQDDIHRAFIEWAKQRGEGNDYSENRHILRFNPPGHWYEIPNLIKNGVLAKLLKDNPGLKYLFCHNIDTMGAYIEPSVLGMHIKHHPCITFEVTPRRIEDRGGGLAKINGHIQLIEGLALPREEDEYRLTYYNTLTNWITIDSLLAYFKLSRKLIMEAENEPLKKERIIEAIRDVERKIPTYVTIKDVKYLWGSGQEDVYPVAQFEKLWGDMTRLKDFRAGYVAVSRYRGQQLKEPAQLYTWVQDGSLEYLKSKARF
jgi:UDP-N-acetylglucosamine pyrophosphorylase/galactokinase/mevalonate kinase-like predicted kinase